MVLHPEALSCSNCKGYALFKFILYYFSLFFLIFLYFFRYYFVFLSFLFHFSSIFHTIDSFFSRLRHPPTYYFSTYLPLFIYFSMCITVYLHHHYVIPFRFCHLYVHRVGRVLRAFSLDSFLPRCVPLPYLSFYVINFGFFLAQCEESPLQRLTKINIYSL